MRGVVAGFALLLLPVAGGAHERSVSYSSWVLAGRNATVTLRLSLRDANRIADDEDTLATSLVGMLSLRAGAALCPPAPGSFRALPTEPGWIARAWRVDCPEGENELRMRSDVLLDVVPSHLHFARVVPSGAGPERVLTEGGREWVLREAGAVTTGGLGTSLADYIGLGVAHIVTGYDHLAFLLALLLFTASVGEAARVVTGFTVGHSLTLACAALGYLRPAQGAVEALIGLSIALVAVENVWLAGGRRDTRAPRAAIAGILGAAVLALRLGRVPAPVLVGVALFSACYFRLLAWSTRPAALRWAVASLFGLVHGLGFAGVLAEMALPRARLLPALLGFNLGVELGQLTAIGLAWPVLRVIVGRGERWQLALVDYGSAAICGLGVFWFTTRAFG